MGFACSSAPLPNLLLLVIDRDTLESKNMRSSKGVHQMMQPATAHPMAFGSIMAFAMQNTEGSERTWAGFALKMLQLMI